MTVTTIYIALLDENVDGWRPARAEHVREDIYRLLDGPPEDEVWAFAPGDLVRCKEQQSSEGSQVSRTILVAYERAS